MLLPSIQHCAWTAAGYSDWTTELTDNVTPRSLTGESGFSGITIHQLILIVACCATCLIVIVTMLAVIAAQRQTRRRGHQNNRVESRRRVKTPPSCGCQSSHSLASDNWTFVYDNFNGPSASRTPMEQTQNNDQIMPNLVLSNLVQLIPSPRHHCQLENGSLPVIKWRPETMDWHNNFDYNRVKIPRPTVIREEPSSHQLPRLYTM